MLKPPSPPGDGRSYCLGMVRSTADYIAAHVARGVRTGKPCYISTSAACGDLEISRASWHRYIRLYEGMGVLRRTPVHGVLKDRHKNPGSIYHYFSRNRLFSELAPGLFFASGKSTKQGDPSPRRRQTRAEAVLAPSALVMSVSRKIPQPPPLSRTTLTLRQQGRNPRALGTNPRSLTMVVRGEPGPAPSEGRPRGTIGALCQYHGDEYVCDFCRARS